MIVVAFIVGFSDRLSESILKTLVGDSVGARTPENWSARTGSPRGGTVRVHGDPRRGGSGPAGYAHARPHLRASRRRCRPSMDGPGELPPSGLPEPTPAARQAADTTTRPIRLPNRAPRDPSRRIDINGPVNLGACDCRKARQGWPGALLTVSRHGGGGVPGRCRSATLVNGQSSGGALGPGLGRLEAG